MARQRLTDDIAAQTCWKYLHGGFDEKTNIQIYDIVHQVIPDKNIAIRMMFEISYHIGYAKSNLMDYMSEVTYKIKKKRIRDKLVLIRSENGN